MRKKLLNNLGLKLASLFLAFIIWFLIVQINDPKDYETFYNVPVKLTNTELLEKEGKVYEVLDNTDEVRVTVYAPRSIIKQLRTSDIIAEADMSKLTDINTIAITYRTQKAEVISFTGDHDAVRLSVENKKKKWIRLVGNTIGEVADGYIVSNTYLDQTNIEISGPESVVSKVDHAGVDIDISNSTTNLSANIDIELYDADGKVLDQKNITKNVASAHMTVEVLATKDVPVQVAYIGEPAEGYLDTGVIESSVSTVKIAGTASVLANVNSINIPAERMDITGKNANLVEIINLKEYLPDNTRFADKSFGGRATVTAYIEPIIEKHMLVPATNIAIVNIPKGFEAQLPPDIENYELEVSGLNEFVGPLRQNLLKGSVDVAAWMEEQEMEELRAGIYTMPVSFELSEEIMVDAPVEVSVMVMLVEDEEEE